MFSPHLRSLVLMSFAGPVALAAAQDPPRVVLHLDEPAFDAPATAAVADVWGLAARCMDLSDAGRTSVHVHNDAAACQQVAGRHRQPHGQDSPGFVVAKGDAFPDRGAIKSCPGDRKIIKIR